MFTYGKYHDQSSRAAISEFILFHRLLPSHTTQTHYYLECRSNIQCKLSTLSYLQDHCLFRPAPLQSPLIEVLTYSLQWTCFFAP